MSFGLAIDPGKRHAGVTLFGLTSRRILAAGLVARPKDDKAEGPTAAVTLAKLILAWTEIALDPVAAASGTVPPLYSIHNVTRFVCETQRTYGGRASEGDANDLFPLAMLNGALSMALWNAAVATYTPQEWGALGKPKTTKEMYAVEARVRARLLPEELATVVWPGAVARTYDVTDAVAIALKWLGRFEPVKIYQRE